MIGTATSHVRHMVLETLKTDLPTSRESGVYFSNYFLGESSCVTGTSQDGLTGKFDRLWAFIATGHSNQINSLLLNNAR